MQNILINNSIQNDLSQYGKLLNYNKGESITYQGNFVYIIMSGNIKISDINIDTGKEQVLYLLGRGDIYDIVSILEAGHHRDYLIQALNDVKLIQIPIHIVQNLLNDQNFNRFFMSYITKTILDLENLVLDTSLKTVRERIIKLILACAEKNSNKYRLIDSLNNEQIAAIVGSVRNVIQRERKELQFKGYLMKNDI